MIRKMKKLSLFVFHEDKEKTLNDLASLGLVHIEITNGVSSENIDNIAAKKHDVSRAKAIINNAICKLNQDTALQKQFGNHNQYRFEVEPLSIQDGATDIMQQQMEDFISGQ